MSKIDDLEKTWDILEQEKKLLDGYLSLKQSIKKLEILKTKQKKLLQKFQEIPLPKEVEEKDHISTISIRKRSMSECKDPVQVWKMHKQPYQHHQPHHQQPHHQQPHHQYQQHVCDPVCDSPVFFDDETIDYLSELPELQQKLEPKQEPKQEPKSEPKSYYQSLKSTVPLPLPVPPSSPQKHLKKTFLRTIPRLCRDS